MTSRTFLTVAALTSLAFGMVGLVLPAQLAGSLGVTTADPLLIAVIRLLSAAYLGYGILAWMMRPVSDVAALRAMAAANAASWGLSGIVLAAAVLGGLGDARAWMPVAMQAAFAVAWGIWFVRVPFGGRSEAALQP